MTAPSYTTDLQIIDDAEDTTNWDELPLHAAGGTETQEPDYFIQGSYCISQSTGAGKTALDCGLRYDYGSNVTISGGCCVFMWQMWTCPNAIATFDNGGLRLGIGSTDSDMNYWNTQGYPFGRQPYGGWQNAAVDPTYTPIDYSEGSPAAGTYRYFGSMPNIVSAVSKGNPHGVDVIRYGRGMIDIVHGDASNGYCTFSGIAYENDSQGKRWGLFQEQAGAYLWKGLLRFGTYKTSCDFRDSYVSIIVDDAPRTYESFNKIEIHKNSSRVDWTGINFTAVDRIQLSPGSFEIVDNADINFDTCVFTDMHTFIFKNNSTVVDTTFRRCSQITQASGTFTSCIFEDIKGPVSLYADDIDNVSYCSFTSVSGSNHAIELSAHHAGNTYTLTGCEYTDYASSDGDTGNECIYNNSGGAVIINVSGGDTPSIRNGSGASTSLVINPVSTTITVKDSSTPPVNLQNARVLVLAASGGDLPYYDTINIDNFGTTASGTHVAHGMSTNDKVQITGASHTANNGVFTITVINANSYTYTMGSAPGSDPTGTIKATWVAVSGLTDENGEVTASRSFNNNQPVTGRARKSSSPPYYKTSDFIGTIDKTGGLSVTVQLSYDE